MDAHPHLRFGVTIALILLGFACSQELPEPPRPTNLAQTDPAIVERFETEIARVQQDPRDPERWQLLGKVYQTHGRLEPAVECYRQSLALEPDDPKTRYFLALAWERLGRMEDAIATLEQVADHAPYAPAHWRLGLWRLDQGDAGGAQNSIEQALKLAPGDRTATLAMARVQLQSTRPQAAAAQLESYLKGQPDDGYARFLLGQAYRQLERDADAERELARGRGREPQWRDPWLDEIDAERTGFRAELDLAVAQLGPDPAKAVAAFERLRQRQPGHVGLLINLGIGYRRVGRLEDSASALSDALHQQPDRPLAHLHLAVTYGASARQGDARQDNARQSDASGGSRSGDATMLDRALKHAERTIELRPTSAKGYAVRADLQTIAGRLDDAVESFEQAAELEPGDPQWLFHAASLRTRQGRWQQAIPLLERCLNQAADHVEALFLLGASQANSGQLAAAATTLERARKLAPDNLQVRQALEQLRQATPRR